MPVACVRSPAADYSYLLPEAPGRALGRGLRSLKHGRLRDVPVRALPSSIFRDKNRRDIGKSPSIWTDSKMETPGSLLLDAQVPQQRLQRLRPQHGSREASAPAPLTTHRAQVWADSTYM
jgi:hypothetical protein